MQLGRKMRYIDTYTSGEDELFICRSIIDVECRPSFTLGLVLVRGGIELA